MKIILLSNVRKVGQKGDVVEVSEGYGRNFLIKNGLAREAVGGQLKTLNNQKAQAKEKEIENSNKVEAKFQEINKKEFAISKPTNEAGHLFAAIREKDIAEVVGVDVKSVVLDTEIKEVGEFPLKIKLNKLKAKITLIVTSS